MFLKQIKITALKSWGVSLLFLSLIISGSTLILSLITTPAYGQAANAWNIEKDASTNLKFYYGIGGTTRLLLTNAGNLNTGTIQVTQDTGVPSGGYSIRRSTSMEFRGGSSGYAFSNNANTATLMTLLDTGNLGIGVSNPTNKLQLSGSLWGDNTGQYYFGTDAGRNLEVHGNSATSYIDMANSTAADYDTRIQSDTSKNFNIYTNSSATSAFTILAGGNIGIGQTSPAGKLTIQAPAQETSPAIRLLQAGQSNYGIDIGVDSDHLGEMNIYSLRNGGQVLLMSFDRTNDRVGIGTTSPTEKLDVSGNITASGNISAQGTFYSVSFPALGSNQPVCRENTAAGRFGICGASDKRLKENIQPLNVSGLDLITKLKPSTFDFIQGAKNQTGFIAQDVLEVLPSAVSKSSDGYYVLSDTTFTPYLVKSLQELNQKNTDLTKQLENQQQQINAMKTEIEKIKSLKNE